MIKTTSSQANSNKRKSKLLSSPQLLRGAGRPSSTSNSAANNKTIPTTEIVKKTESTASHLRSPSSLLQHPSRISEGGGKSKRKKKDGDKDASEEFEETVNNLYWIESEGLPGLWYGDYYQKPQQSKIQKADEMNGESDARLVQVWVIGLRKTVPEGDEESDRSTLRTFRRQDLEGLEYSTLLRCKDKRIAGATIYNFLNY